MGQQVLDRGDHEAGEGVRFSALAGSFVDVMAANPRDRALLALVRDLDDDQRLWSPAAPAELPASLRPEPGHDQFVAVGPTCAVRVSVPGGVPHIQSLRALADDNPGLLTPRFALLLLMGLRTGRGTVPAERWGRAFLWLREAPFDVEPSEAVQLLTATLLEQIAASKLAPDACLAGWPRLDPLHPIDVARLTLEHARQMWLPVWQSPLVLRRLARVAMLSDIDREQMVRLMYYANASFVMRREMVVEVAGVPLSVPEDPAHYSTVWTVSRLMPATGVDGDAIRALIPDRVLPQATHDFIEAESDADPDLLRGLALGLVRDAQELGQFEPMGTFEVDLPEGLGLREFGVTGLRVHVTPEKMWVRALDPKPNGPIHHWEPGHYRWSQADEQAARDTMPLAWRQMTAWIDVVCAALWHDLRVAGDSSLRLVNRTRARRRGGGGPAQTPEAADVRIVYLPRTVRLSGAREWGTAEEREYIRVSRHGVKEHTRRLQENWKPSLEAQAAARDYGVVLPEGYTFVRPFARGGSEGDAVSTPRVVVRSRGLASLVTLGGRLKRR